MKPNINFNEHITFDKIISYSISIYKDNFSYFIKILGVFLAPMIVFIYFAYGSYKNMFMKLMSQQMQDPAMLATMGKNFLLMFALGIVVSAAYYLANQTVIKGTANILFEKKMSVQETILSMLQVAFPLLITGLFTIIFVCIGFMFCIIPGFILMVYLIFFTQVNVIEEKYFFSSMARSFSLVSGRFWETLVIPLVFYLGFSTIVGIIQTVVLSGSIFSHLDNFIKNPNDPGINQMMQSIYPTMFLISMLSNLVFYFFQPILIIAITIKFLNIRAMKEDIEGSQK